MTSDLPPGFAWAGMAPELLVTDLQASLRFWCGLCGFLVAYERPEDGFAYLDRKGCQVMLEEAGAPGRRWVTGPLERPFGRGINFQIGVDDVDALRAAMSAAGWPLFLELETVWYRQGNRVKPILSCLACLESLKGYRNRNVQRDKPRQYGDPLPCRHANVG